MKMQFSELQKLFDNITLELLISLLCDAIKYGFLVGVYGTYRYFKNLKYSKLILGIDKKNLNIVTGNITGPLSRTSTNVPTMQIGDIDALIEIVTFFRNKTKIKFDKYISSELSKEKYRDNLITIGGSRWNFITKLFLEKINSPFSIIKWEKYGDDWGIIDNISGEKYQDIEDENRNVLLDYGFIIKAPNPYNPENYVFIIGGSRTYGVLAASKCFSASDGYYTKNLLEILKRLVRVNFFGINRYFGISKYYGILIKVEIEDGKIISAKPTAVYRLKKNYFEKTRNN